MKHVFLFFILFLWSGTVVYAQPQVRIPSDKAKPERMPVNPDTATCHDYTFYLGTYTQGKSKGIYQYVFHKNGTFSLTGCKAVTSNPSFLTFSRDHRFLLAVNENNPGTVASYAVFPDTLHFLSRSLSGGDAPCYVSVNRAGNVLTANYGSGTVGLLKMGKQGKLSGLLSVENHNTGVQKAHAHEARFLPGSRQVVAVDLGTCQLWFSKLDSAGQKLVPDSPRTLTLPAGSGPRHFVLSPNGKWMYVVNELANTVSIIRKKSDGTWAFKEMISTLPPAFKGTSYGGEIQLSKDGRFLYVSNRGYNTIAVFCVSHDGAALKLIDNVSVHGDFPRFFTLTPDGNYLLVANQKSDNLVSFRRNKQTGLLRFVSETAAPSPVCILIY